MVSPQNLSTMRIVNDLTNALLNSSVVIALGYALNLLLSLAI